MKLTDFQKDIVRAINKGEVYDFESFVCKFCIYEGSANLNEEGGIQLIDHHPTFLVKDEKPILSQFKEFVSLYKKLKQKELIKMVETYVRVEVKIRQAEYPDNLIEFKSIKRLMKDYETCRIISLTELQEFEDNNFRTEEEIEKEDEIKDRKIAIGTASLTAEKTIKNTRILAIASICVAVISSGLSIYFNQKNLEKKYKRKKNIYSRRLDKS